jgi:hypothetical protein
MNWIGDLWRRLTGRKALPKQTVILEGSLRGIIARWAVHQSPYVNGPASLEAVLVEATKRFREDPQVGKVLGSAVICLPYERCAVEAWVKDLLDMPEVKAWNNRKNGREGHGSISVYDNLEERDPDDDFIDLDALYQNIAGSLMGL